MTEQPEGIANDSYDLPTPEGAARRVNEFLAWYGDGLVYAETGAPPLFARDLQALTNLASGRRQPPPRRCPAVTPEGDLITAGRQCQQYEGHAHDHTWYGDNGHAYSRWAVARG
ncbi:hypothetical protein VA596_41510 [Amycolatopsis sp., V23-08]|uniref:Uncharacterized protein n=1 Tax=Amycolatopsis heterodermiae TaxID=3110235 RepID=A0ABU5RKG7_9PSEU|nr:hypothetical protein [Amycolatopsis sp., V23-08]MEA5366064.1 hypothetical protein [Amycolatopsis sp., V23-08]